VLDRAVLGDGGFRDLGHALSLAPGRHRIRRRYRIIDM